MDVISAIATGNSVGGIGVIRISGDKATEVAEKVFRPKDGTALSDLGGYRAKLGNIIIEGEAQDEAVALVFKAPKSYTGEDVVELSVHGGILIVEKTLEATFKAGARPAEAGEFTKRAFLNGKMDLTQAESVADLISAEGENALKASFNAYSGALGGKINGVLDDLINCSSLMAAWVDYPDEEIEELDDENLKLTLENAEKDLNKLLREYNNGQIMTRGIDTAIVGKVNAGKSTLMNYLSGENKSIVTEIAGTTRDVVESTVRLGSLVLHLNDTAGIRDSENVVEAIGVERAVEKIETAVLVIAVFDSSLPLDENDEKILEKLKGKNVVAVINKTDLPAVLNEEKIKATTPHIIHASAKNGDGLENLESEIKNTLGVTNFNTSSPMLANERQRKCVEEAEKSVREALQAVNAGVTRDAVNVLIDTAIDSLLTLTGKKVSTEVVNNIFSKFCVGK